jgi:hypothetical protein
MQYYCLVLLQSLAQAAKQPSVDREGMLKQIEILKSARQEAEQQRGQVQRLEKDLATRQQQLEQLQDQHKQVLVRVDQQQRELQVRQLGAPAGPHCYCKLR